MSFRYALNRNTAAPWEVCTYIKKYWKDIDIEFKRQIKEDIKREINMVEPNASYYDRVSNDWYELLDWIKDNQNLS